MAEVGDVFKPGQKCDASGIYTVIHDVEHRETHVGSRTGALMLGSGGHSFAFAQDLSPVTMITSPVPATSNRTGAFDASGFPIDFTIELSGIPFAHE
jgi:hypothetical protein